MVKIVILSAIVILSSMIGFEFGQAVKVRRDNLSRLLDGIINLENEIFYCLTPLYEAAMKTSKRTSKPISIFFNDLSEELTKNDTESVRDAFKSCIQKDSNILGLSNDDYDILLDLSASIGTTDIDGQKKIFDIAVNRIKNNLKHATDDAEKNVKMYRVLGVSIGLMIAIFLI